MKTEMPQKLRCSFCFEEFLPEELFAQALRRPGSDTLRIVAAICHTCWKEGGERMGWLPRAAQELA